MPDDEHYLMSGELLAENGVVISTGRVNEQSALDGLEFVYISKVETPDEPVIILPRQFAIIAIKQIADSLRKIIGKDREFMHDRLQAVSSAIQELYDDSERRRDEAEEDAP